MKELLHYVCITLLLLMVHSQPNIDTSVPGYQTPSQILASSASYTSGTQCFFLNTQPRIIEYNFGTPLNAFWSLATCSNGDPPEENASCQGYLNEPVFFEERLGTSYVGQTNYCTDYVFNGGSCGANNFVSCDYQNIGNNFFNAQLTRLYSSRNSVFCSVNQVNCLLPAINDVKNYRTYLTECDAGWAAYGDTPLVVGYTTRTTGSEWSNCVDVLGDYSVIALSTSDLTPFATFDNYRICVVGSTLYVRTLYAGAKYTIPSVEASACPFVLQAMYLACACGELVESEDYGINPRNNADPFARVQYYTPESACDAYLGDNGPTGVTYSASSWTPLANAVPITSLDGWYIGDSLFSCYNSGDGCTLSNTTCTWNILNNHTLYSQLQVPYINVMSFQKHSGSSGQIGPAYTNTGYMDYLPADTISTLFPLHQYEICPVLPNARFINWKVPSSNTSLYCIPPINQVCTGYNSNLRGCAGYGYCPVAPNGITCNGQICLHNGICNCPYNLGGLDCSISLTSIVTQASFTCAQYNPCEPYGFCYDTGSPLQATCVCRQKWYGIPQDATDDGTGMFLAAYTLRFRMIGMSSQHIAQHLLLHQCRMWVSETGYGYLSVDYASQAPSVIGSPTWFPPSLSSHTAADDNTVTLAQAIINAGYGWASAPLQITAGYNCLDTRSNSRYNGKAKYCGGFMCNCDCPLCYVNPSTGEYGGSCVQASLVSTPYCLCSFNYGSATAAALCESKICPWSGAANTWPCGAQSGAGVCHTPQNHTVTLNPLSGYIGMCVCANGYSGPDCSIRVCPANPVTGQICSGNGAAGAAASDLPKAGQVAHGSCNVTSGQCVCARGWTSNPLGSCPGHTGACVISGSCEYAQCPLGPSGSECNGLVVYQAGNPFQEQNTVNVCDRNISGPVCQCALAYTFSGANIHYSDAFYGSNCSNSYFETGICLANPGDESICSDVPYANCEPSTPSGVPSCVCPTNVNGTFCQGSRCGGNSSNACNFGSVSVSPSGRCVSGYNGAFSCQCNVLDAGGNACLPQYAATASPTCALYGSNTSDTAGNCEVPKLGCTYNNLKGFSLCNGVTNPGSNVCQRNSTTGSWHCVCPVGFSGQYCQTVQACGGNCQGICCPYQGSTFVTYYPSSSSCHFIPNSVTSDTCLCNASFTGPSCTINQCQLTGGNATDAGCICPSDSTYTPTADFQYNPPTVGCIKNCPQYTYPTITCGVFSSLSGKTVSCGYQDKNENSRCNTTLYANQVGSLSCDCSVAGVNPILCNPSLDVRWTTNNITGACEPYCENLSQDPGSGPCVCRPGYAGARCDSSPCNGQGQIVNGRCVCTNPLFTSASSCLTTVCDQVANNYFTPGQGFCSCDAPLIPSMSSSSPLCVNPCANGVANTTTGTCQCNTFYDGLFCQNSFCVAGSIIGNTSCTCLEGVFNATTKNCTQATCVHGTPGENLDCICASTVWGGIHCNTSNCVNGSPVLKNSAWICNCTNGYSVNSFTGLCTIAPSSPTSSTTTSRPVSTTTTARPASTSVVVTTTTTTAPVILLQDNNSLGAGAIAGITIGAVVGVALIVLGVFYYCKIYKATYHPIVGEPET